MHASYKKCNWLKLHSKYVFEVQDCSECESNLSTKFHEYCTANEVICYDLPDIITRECIVLEQACANLGCGEKKDRRNELKKKKNDPKRKCDLIINKRVHNLKIGSEIAICNKLFTGNVQNNPRLNQNSSENSKIVQRNASYTEYKDKLLSNNLDNEQQSSSIPDISCELNCINDERLDQADFKILCDNDFKKSKLQTNCGTTKDFRGNIIGECTKIDNLSRIKPESHFSHNDVSIHYKTNIIKPKLNNFTNSKVSQFCGNLRFKLKDIKPLCTKIQNIRNKGRVYPQNKPINSGLNTAYKSRINSSKSIFTENGSYYNSNYIRQFNLEASPESAALPKAKLIDNSDFKASIFSNRTYSDGKSIIKMNKLNTLKDIKSVKSNFRSKMSINTLDCFSPVKAIGCFSPIQESNTTTSKRWFSPGNQNRINFPRLPSNSRSNSRNIKSVSRKQTTRNTKSTFSPSKSKFMNKRKITDLRVNLNFTNQLNQIKLISSEVQSPKIKSATIK